MEISKEAWEEARRLLGSKEPERGIVAAALQRHMDATVEAKATESKLRDALVVAKRTNKRRLERAEAAELIIQETQGAHVSWVQEERKQRDRADKAEARAQELENIVAELRAQLAMGLTK